MSNRFIGTDIDRAVEILRNGGLVGLPTETVYGLAADASQKEAVARVFTAKGRPNNHPLIVHVGSIDTARHWSSMWTQSAELLGTTYWPGPLSVVVEKSPDVLVEVINTPSSSTIPRQSAERESKSSVFPERAWSSKSLITAFQLGK